MEELAQSLEFEKQATNKLRTEIVSLKEHEETCHGTSKTQKAQIRDLEAQIQQMEIEQEASGEQRNRLKGDLNDSNSKII